jgi:hypothetical protein
MKGLLGPTFYQPRQPPTKLQVLRRQAFIGGLLWMAGVMLLAALLEDSPLAIIASVFAIGGWFVLMWLSVRYFYYFALKRDDTDFKRQ